MNPRFLNIINSSKAVLVDFYAEWCIPCKDVTPVLKAVKKAISQVKIVKVDVDRNPIIASHFKIHRLPTLIFFKNGELTWSGEGVYDVEELKDILMDQLNGN